MNFTIKPNIYPFTFVVSWDESITKLNKYLKPWNCVIEDGEDQNFTITFEDECLIVIRLEKAPVTIEDYGTLAHEIFHGVYSGMVLVGITLSRTSEEAFAYLTSFLTEQIYKRLNLKN